MTTGMLVKSTNDHLSLVILPTSGGKETFVSVAGRDYIQDLELKNHQLLTEIVSLKMKYEPGTLIPIQMQIEGMPEKTVYMDSKDIT